MTDLNLDREKCAQRRRIAARRDGVNAAPIRFLREAIADADKTTLETVGWLPKDDREALDRINAMRPDPAAPWLTMNDIHIHYVEAANGSFIADRYGFLSDRTLKNIATGAGAGFSFMNSHRTGGLSAGPAELPYGKTFAGKFERTEGGDMRTVVGFYMLRGQQPNGPNGPSTDAIHASIIGGTIFDVSVGLWGGDHICDVCGEDIYEHDEFGRYSCVHVPGTHLNMSPEQIAAQEARGVTKGRASYTLMDARCGEVSAVYDGAVDGAGFNKALAFRARMSDHDRAEARESFASLIGSSDEFSALKATKTGEPAAVQIPEGFLESLAALISELGRPRVAAAPINHTRKQGAIMPEEITTPAAERKEEKPAVTPEAVEALSARIEELTGELATEKTARATEKAEKEAAVTEKLKTEANAKVDGWERDGKLSGNGTVKARAVYVAAATGQKVTPLMVEELVAALPKFDTTRIGENAVKDADTSPTAVHFKALKLTEDAGLKQGDPKFATVYEQKRAAVLKESGHAA